MFLRFIKSIKKPVLYFVVVVSILLILVLVFLSPIAKYLVEKYDVKYSGREIKIESLYINLFTGYVCLESVKVYECKSDSVFLTAKSISANIAMLKLLSKTYELSELIIDEPRGIIIQSKKEFNFNDLIKKFSSKSEISKSQNKPTEINVLNIKIRNGIFYYLQKDLPIYYSIKHVNIETPGKLWNEDTMAVKFSIVSGIGNGYAKGNLSINFKSLDYKSDLFVNKFDLSVFGQYLKDISYYGSLNANLDANLKIKGNFKESENITGQGLISINDLSIRKSETEDYLSFKKFSLNIIQLSPKNRKYSFDSVSLVKPYFKYERYDQLDNLQTMFGRNGNKVVRAKSNHENLNILFQIADYVKILAKNFLKSQYEINRLAIYEGNLHYIDYSLIEKFDVSATPLYIIADSIKRSDKWVNLSLETNLKPYGKISANLSINPKDSSDFNIKYRLNQLPLTMFNPYMVTYTSFPLNRGTIALNGNWLVNNGNIKSNNHLIIMDPRINKKQKRNGARWIPLKLIMFFVREKGNVIDYEIPITGNIIDPKFKLNDVISDILSNVFLKPLSTFYRSKVTNVENEIENSFAMNWEIGKMTIENKQEIFLKKLARYFKKHKEINLLVTPITYTEKEKEYILLFEAKKKYYLHLNNKTEKKLNYKDTAEIEKISMKYPSFFKYLNKKIDSFMLFTVQDRCAKLIGLTAVENLLNKLELERRNMFLSVFKSEGVETQVKFKLNRSQIPYNGFSYFKLEYNGLWPEQLKSAYFKMSELNNKSPRIEFKSKRKQNF